MLPFRNRLGGDALPLSHLRATITSNNRVELRWTPLATGNFSLTLRFNKKNRQNATEYSESDFLLQTGKATLRLPLHSMHSSDIEIQFSSDGWMSEPLPLNNLLKSRFITDELDFTPPYTGSVSGVANIHGVETDHSYPPPSTNPDDWEILNKNRPVVHHSETIGQRKIDPVGFYLTQQNLALFYNSGWDNYEKWFELRDERGYAGSSNQAGSLMAFSDNFTQFKDYSRNPVLDRPQRTWQGRNRTNPYALVWHPEHKLFYCFYGDFAENADNDLYPGRRALGVAGSTDLVHWNYLTTEKPLFHILDMYDFNPPTFGGISDVTRQGRVYAYGATYHNGYIYLLIGGSTNRELGYTFIIRSKDAMDGWEFVREAEHRPMPFRYRDKWYTVRNIRDPHDTEKRAIGIVSGSTLDEMDGTPDYIFSTGHRSSAGVSRQLFMYNGVWHVAYQQSDEEDYRDMYIARQK